MIRKFDYNNLIQRKRDLDELYRELTIQYSGDTNLLKKLSDEYRILLKLIDAGQKNATLEEAAKTAGTSPDSAKRWINGKLPQYFTYASKRKICLERIKETENFLFLIGVYQSQIVAGIPENSFIISTKDKLLGKTLETCIQSCFGDAAIIKEGRHEGFTDYVVNSKSLMSLIKDMTNDNHSAPTELFKTENKKAIYYSGFLTNIKISLEPYGRKRRLHASLTRSRGDLIPSLHQYLDEKRIPHSYYKKANKVRFRRKECLALTKILSECTAKRIQKQRKYA